MPNPYLLQRYGGALSSGWLPNDDDDFNAANDPLLNDGAKSSFNEPQVFHVAVPLPAYAAPMVADSDDECEGIDAALNFAYFPQAVHMRQTVLQPSRPAAERRVVELIDEHSAPESTTASATIAPMPRNRNSEDGVWSDLADSAAASAARRREVEDLIQQTRAAMMAASHVIQSGAASEPVASQPTQSETALHDFNVPQAAPLMEEASETAIVADTNETRRRGEPDELQLSASSSDANMNTLQAVAPEHEHEAPHTIETIAVLSPSEAAKLYAPMPRLAVEQLAAADARDTAKKFLSRLPPAPAPAPRPLVVAPQNAADQDIRPGFEEKKKNVVQNERRTRPEPQSKKRKNNREPLPKVQPMIPMEAVESIMKSVYAIMSASDASRHNTSAAGIQSALVTSDADPARLTEASSPIRHAPLLHPSAAAQRVDPHVVLSPRPITITPAQRVSHGEVTKPTASAEPLVVSSLSLPRIGVAAVATEEPTVSVGTVRSTREAHPTSKPTSSASRLTQPTESWLHKGVAVSNGRQVRQAFFDPNVVSTQPSKEERVARLNRAAQRLVRNR